MSRSSRSRFGYGLWSLLGALCAPMIFSCGAGPEAPEEQTTKVQAPLNGAG